MRFVCCSHFWFWTGILRPLVSFPFSLQEIGILCVCLCLLIFLSSSVLCCTDILVRSLCMIPKACFVVCMRCRSYIYRSLSGSSMLALLRMVRVSLGSGSFRHRHYGISSVTSHGYTGLLNRIASGSSSVCVQCCINDKRYRNSGRCRANESMRLKGTLDYIVSTRLIGKADQRRRESIGKMENASSEQSSQTGFEMMNSNETQWWRIAERMRAFYRFHHLIIHRTRFLQQLRYYLGAITVSGMYNRRAGGSDLFVTLVTILNILTSTRSGAINRLECAAQSFHCRLRDPVLN